MMMDSKFLNYMLGDKVCRRWNGEEVDWEDNYPYVYIRDAWEKVGVKASMSDHMDVPNTYSIDGRQVTRREAFLHAQKVLNKFVTDSDWM